jgi:hypothetical protein
MKGLCNWIRYTKTHILTINSFLSLQEERFIPNFTLLTYYFHTNNASNTVISSITDSYAREKRLNLHHTRGKLGYGLFPQGITVYWVSVLNRFFV